MPLNDITSHRVLSQGREIFIYSIIWSEALLLLLLLLLVMRKDGRGKCNARQIN